MLKRLGRDLKRYWAYTLYSAKATLKAEVASSYLSWLWWILNPLVFMLIYTFVSIQVFQRSKEYFPVFVMIGLTAWNFFNHVVTGSTRLLRANKRIITKAYLPKYMLLIKSMLVEGFHMLISFALVLILALIYKVPVSWRLVYVLPHLISLFIITFGFGTVMLHLGAFVEDLSNVTHLSLRLLFYMSGIFYDISTLKNAELGAALTRFNPMAMILGGLRGAILYDTPPDWLFLGGWTLVGVILAFIGLKLIYAYDNSYGKVV